jgi:hypothetical protein
MAVSVTAVMRLTNRNETRALAMPATNVSVDFELIVGLILLVLLIGRAGTGAL